MHNLCPNPISFGNFLNNFKYLAFQIYQIVIRLTNCHILGLPVAICGFRCIIVFCIIPCLITRAFATSSSSNTIGWSWLSDRDSPSTVEEKKLMSWIPYASVVGSLMYVMVATRLDLAYVVGVVSRYMLIPGKKHWEAVKQIFWHLRGTTDMQLTFDSGH